MRTSLIVLVVLLAAAAARAEPNQAIVLGGGTTAAEGQAWLKRWEKLAPLLSPFVSLAPGFPKAVASATVAGMKPGFHVVLLGFCEPAELEARLGVFKAAYPGTYSREVQAGTRDACPRLPLPVTVASTVSVKKEGKVLVGSHLLTDKLGAVRVLLFDASNELLGVEKLDWEFVEDPTPHHETCSVTLQAKKQRIALDADCKVYVPACSAGVTDYRDLTNYAIGDGKIEQSTKRLSESKQDYCD